MAGSSRRCGRQHSPARNSIALCNLFCLHLVKFLFLYELDFFFFLSNQISASMSYHVNLSGATGSVSQSVVLADVTRLAMMSAFLHQLIGWSEQDNRDMKNTSVVICTQSYI